MAIIVDVSHTYNRVLHMNKEALAQNPLFISHLLCSMLLSIASKFGASNTNPMVLAVDSRSNWRKIWYSENCKSFPEYANLTYKGNRVKDDTLDWTAIYKAIDDTLDALDLYSDFRVIRVDGAEADDIIAIGAKYFKSNHQRSFIITSDKDMKQCQIPNWIEIYDPIKLIFVPDIDVKRFKTIHIMIGDKSDNILAIKPRLGEKTAIKLLPELDSLLKTNVDMRDRFEFNKHLIDFDYIPRHITENIFDQLERTHSNYHAMYLMNAFSKLRLIEMMDKITRFKMTDAEIKTTLNTIGYKKQAMTNYETQTLDNFFN